MNALKHVEATVNDGKSVALDEQFNINLRQSCLDCPFVISCPVSQERGGPEMDVLVGSYRVAALKERCLL
jgi:hypothetical protein